MLYYLFKIVLPTPLPDFKIFTAQCMHRWELSHHHAGFCYMLTCSYFVCHFCHVRLCVANGISPANLVHDDNGQLTYLLTFSIIMGQIICSLMIMCLSGHIFCLVIITEPNLRMGREQLSFPLFHLNKKTTSTKTSISRWIFIL